MFYNIKNSIIKYYYALKISNKNFNNLFVVDTPNHIVDQKLGNQMFH